MKTEELKIRTKQFAHRCVKLAIALSKTQLGIDEAALDIARKGIYPESVGADVSRERLNQFFTKEPGGVKIKKQIRDRVVFSLQSVVKDPPFSRLDLVSCRNLMIYMDNVLQKKIIPLFHYTLNPGGILFLDTSESIGEHTDLFQPANSTWKIFESKKGISGAVIAYPAGTLYNAPQEIESGQKDKLPGAGAVQEMVERAIIDEYAPAGVLINDKYEILHFVGKTDRYLVPPTGKPSFHILNMARADLKPPLTTALHKAVREKTDAFCKSVRVAYNGAFCVVDISDELGQQVAQGITESKEKENGQGKNLNTIPGIRREHHQHRT